MLPYMGIAIDQRMFTRMRRLQVKWRDLPRFQFGTKINFACQPVLPGYSYIVNSMVTAQI